MTEQNADGKSDKLIDARTFWRAIGERAIGVTIVTARGVEGPAGLLALSAAHVTADPPSMLVSIDERTSALASVLQARHFAINFLPADAKPVAEAFGGQTGLKGAARFKPGDWGTLRTGAPIFNDAIGAVDCLLEQTFGYASTTIVIGRVVDFAIKGSGMPLIYFRGRYLTDPELS